MTYAEAKAAMKQGSICTAPAIPKHDACTGKIRRMFVIFGADWAEVTDGNGRSRTAAISTIIPAPTTRKDKTMTARPDTTGITPTPAMIECLKCIIWAQQNDLSEIDVFYEDLAILIAGILPERLTS